MQQMAESPKRKPNDNPWYCLATLYGEPQADDLELQRRNREVWNRCMALRIGEKRREELIKAGRHTTNELTPLTPEEEQDINTLFSGRIQAQQRRIELKDLLREKIIDFSYVDFKYEFICMDMVFPYGIFFHDATFSQRADFTGATFFEVAILGGATFSQRANFAGATFFEGAIFAKATFQDANFAGATFFGWSYFVGATFIRSAKFTDTTFALANFMDTTFRTVTFDGAIFSGNVLFGGATFEFEVSFVNAEMKIRPRSRVWFSQLSYHPSLGLSCTRAPNGAGRNGLFHRRKLTAPAGLSAPTSD